jgi:protein transport protein SEC61 subunit gamma-like protein
MDVVERSWKVQRRIEERVRRFGKGRFGRVLKMARKPTSEEFAKTVQLTGVGLLLLGGLGFLIYLLMTVVPAYLQGLIP